MIQVDGHSVSDLAGEIVLQRSPLTQNDATIAAPDFSMLGRILRDIHLNCPAGLAVQLLIEANSGHCDILHPAMAQSESFREASALIGRKAKEKPAPVFRGGLSAV
jgi:hypothetical protein